jgi:starch synthase
MPIRVAFIAAECEPWAKTGGLADVVDALARALGQIGSTEVETPVDVFLPLYRGISVPDGASRRPLRVPDPTAASGSTKVSIVDVAGDGYRLRLVEHAPAFDRPGFYGDAKGDYPDNAWRFGLFCRAALTQLASEPRPPDVLHLHDWHAAPALLWPAGLGAEPLPAAASLLTIHNLAYHGWTPADRLPELGLAPGDGIIARGADGLDLLRSAIERSDLVNTVSPGFAVEALGPEQGMGLDGVLRARGSAFFGILNGLDTDLWDPARDETLAATYSRDDRSGKAACRADLLAAIGLDADDPGPVLAMIGRLDPQKGFDLLTEATPRLLDRGIRLAILGSGHPELVASLRVIAKRAPARVALVERFDRDLARKMYAGADGFLMPSRFEPCGTGQMIALRYGTPPIVRATGGLRDTVTDVDANPSTGTGFTFDEAQPEALIEACDRFVRRFAPGEAMWEALLDRGMAVDFDWQSSSAPRYVEAYRRAVAIARG